MVSLCVEGIFQLLRKCLWIKYNFVQYVDDGQTNFQFNNVAKFMEFYIYFHGICGTILICSYINIKDHNYWIYKSFNLTIINLEQQKDNRRSTLVRLSYLKVNQGYNTTNFDPFINESYQV